eukprot:CAMPEP_0182434884 /NCGR_PEP_ID=MMETSP1167-20130531/72353_1 /TAXON_ID=2988 /ORGANISM="Mallomonas Sp, Strain CCMP3275" /LENGTH=249 /DNA_ID=CAMNT_0024625255 /DNA_START=68 /DNA_END=813 /DNA_ORIENTATION=+
MNIMESEEDVSGNNQFDPELRAGKWTVEEEVYSSKLVELFMKGQVVLTTGDGRTLRSFLARRLKCSPMRISKKYSGFHFLGARYQDVELSRDLLEANQAELETLRQAFIETDAIVQSRRNQRRKYSHKYKISQTKVVDSSMISEYLPVHDKKSHISDHDQSNAYHSKRVDNILSTINSNEFADSISGEYSLISSVFDDSTITSSSYKSYHQDQDLDLPTSSSNKTSPASSSCHHSTTHSLPSQPLSSSS